MCRSVYPILFNHIIHRNLLWIDPTSILQGQKSARIHIHKQSLGEKHEHKDEEGHPEAVPLHLKHDGYA